MIYQIFTSDESFMTLVIFDFCDELWVLAHLILSILLVWQAILKHRFKPKQISKYNQDNTGCQVTYHRTCVKCSYIHYWNYNRKNLFVKQIL